MDVHVLTVDPSAGYPRFGIHDRYGGKYSLLHRAQVRQGRRTLPRLPDISDTSENMQSFPLMKI
jgi:hypothetical protein